MKMFLLAIVVWTVMLFGLIYKSSDEHLGIARSITKEDVICDVEHSTIIIKQGVYNSKFSDIIQMCPTMSGQVMETFSGSILQSDNTLEQKGHNNIPYDVPSDCITLAHSFKIAGQCE